MKQRLVLMLLMCSLVAGYGQVAANQEDEAAAEDIAAFVVAEACADPSDEVKICLGDDVCVRFDSYQWPTNGACPEGWTLKTIGSVTDACTAAAAIANPAPCPSTCQDNGVTPTQSQNATCCTVKEVRQCDPWPKPQDTDGTDD